MKKSKQHVKKGMLGAGLGAVGGGLVGLSFALSVARAGLRVLVVDHVEPEGGHLVRVRVRG